MMHEKTRALAYEGLFAALVAAGAFIQIPVPYLDYFTLQFFFVLLAGMILGARRGAVSVGCYVLLGLLGIPIFAAGGGIGYILRPSFGFLAAFIVAAYGVGWIAERQKNTARGMLKAALTGLLITYGMGLLYKYLILNFYLGTKTPISVILLSCFPLDLPGDVILCFLASALAPRLRSTIAYMQ